MNNLLVWLLLVIGIEVRGQTCDFTWGDYVIVTSALPLDLAPDYCSSLTRSGTTAQFPTSVNSALFTSLQSLASVCILYTSPTSSQLFVWYTSTTITTTQCPVLDPITSTQFCLSSLQFVCVFNSATTVTSSFTQIIDSTTVTVSSAVTTDTNLSLTTGTVSKNQVTTVIETVGNTTTTIITETRVNVITELETETREVTEVDNTDTVQTVSLTSTTSVPTTTTVISATTTTATFFSTLSLISTLLTCPDQ